MSSLALQYLLFLAQVATFGVGLLLVVAIAAALLRRRGGPRRGTLRVDRLNERYRALADAVKDAMLSPRERKSARKARVKADKARDKAGAPGERPSVFVLDFRGDVRASAVRSLREEVTAVIGAAGPGDSVLLRLESGGGQVHAYGLAASQLQRLVDAGLKLTVAVDKVAASGGYMMAAVADTVVAAPFAIVGSIGVVTGLPNFKRLLDKHEVDFEQLTSGRYKRTLTLFGENTDEGRAKMQQQLDETHDLFKDFVARRRPNMDIEAVATGEYWYGTQAADKGLVDEVQTSDAWLLKAAEHAELYRVRYEPTGGVARRLSLAVETALERVMWAAQGRGARGEVWGS